MITLGEVAAHSHMDMHALHRSEVSSEKNS